VVYGKVRILKEQLDLAQRHVILLQGYVGDLEHNRAVILQNLEQLKIGLASRTPTLPAKEMVKRKWAEGPQAVGTSRGVGPVKNLQENPNFPHKKGEPLGGEELSSAQIMAQVSHRMALVKDKNNKMIIHVE
jgi:hypothetical protein